MNTCAAPTLRLPFAGCLLSVVLTLGTLLPKSGHAEPWVPRHDVFLGESAAQLGSSMVVNVVLDNGSRRVARLYVGAPNATKDGLLQAGAVYIYNPAPQGWLLANTLYASMPQAGAHFGATLAFGTGQLAVGAPDFASGGAGAGRVEFFTDNGLPPAVLALSAAISGGAGQHYGRALAMDGDMLAISYLPSSDAGCVTSYRYSPAVPHLRPLPAIHNFICGVAGAKLGASMAIRRTGDADFVLVAGAPGESRNGNALAGAAHVYAPNPDVVTGGLIDIGTLAAPDPAFLDVFGTSVGVDSNYVYVGATGRDNGAGRVGSVTIFKPAAVFGYDLVNEYFPEDADIGGHCGASLSVDTYNNDRFIVGCPDSSGVFVDDGKAYVFEKTSFLGQPVWVPSSLTTGLLSHGADHLGSSVAIFGVQAFVGARTTDAVGPPTVDNGGWWEFGPDAALFEDGFE